MKLFLLLFLSTGIFKLPALREGTHAITYQVIGWDQPGKVTIKKITDGTFKVSGGQKSKNNKDYLKIDGKLQVVNDRELIFNGEILTRASDINGGMECKRSGAYHFKATGKRKYYRLQEMINCEGGMTTDYIDIYF